MRELTTAAGLRQFMTGLGRAVTTDVRVFLTGGATAVLLGLRESTLDVDLKAVPDLDDFYRAIPALKESLHLNFEMASPADFIPVRSGWEDRSPFIAQVGRVAFFHFELAAQALAKIERGHTQDMKDVSALIARGLVSPIELRSYFQAIEGELYRFPAIDPPSFRTAVERVTG